ncbi:MAG TPA: hypothetical protein VFW17_04090 [Ktedonobacterales bacterium]|jgi:hypothetical protein|nr:hypothetical protein [Ktedonobacterales bacterium]
MERKTSRNLYLIAILLDIVGIILFTIGTGAAIATANTATGTPSDAGAASFSILGLISILLLIVGSVFALIAWIGALIKTAKLGQWVWFILLIVFSGITMLVYIFAGPTQPANSGQMA